MIVTSFILSDCAQLVLGRVIFWDNIVQFMLRVLTAHCSNRSVRPHYDSQWRRGLDTANLCHPHDPRESQEQTYKQSSVLIANCFDTEVFVQS